MGLLPFSGPDCEKCGGRSTRIGFEEYECDICGYTWEGWLNKPQVDIPRPRTNPITGERECGYSEEPLPNIDNAKRGRKQEDGGFLPNIDNARGRRR